MAYLDEADHRRISDAVAAAEETTSGEIVTVLADRSDGYSDIALAWAAAVAFLAMTVWAWLGEGMLALFDWTAGGWNHEWTTTGVLALFTAIAIVKFLAVWLIQLWQPLKFALIPRRVKRARVRERAVELFKVGADRRTIGRTGVVIYLSMREHRAEIVADAAINEKVSLEIWGEAMSDMLDHIAEGRVADGIIAGVADVGAVLSAHFPRAGDDRNELPDRVVEL